ncbi:cytochrome c [Maribacter litopenaei]|uniref:Cytochrome c n=1 Tax=Maribacter litopenaei TaxID=2976127 RepID=A0ABY5Y8X5_9FLAO|nr:cytochrome c [Maribacter litopenaei]UWX55497.1 cytochrome c [Maribacter litopenaei]
MKNKAIAIMTFSVLILASCNQPKEKKVEVVEEANSITLNLAERGEYLVNIIGCADCHTPKKMSEMGPVPDMDRYMMGFDSSGALPPIPENVPLGPWALFAGDLTAAVGSWGTTYAGNLTPHETGIGSWTLKQFKKAIKGGKYKGLDDSRPIMPPMPVEAYRSMKDEDVEAIFAYLKSLKPIENVVPAYTPPTS